jgi:hypothetical protein
LVALGTTTTTEMKSSKTLKMKLRQLKETQMEV